MVGRCGCGPEPINYFWTDGKWDEARISVMLTESVVTMVFMVPINKGGQDRLWWKGMVDDRFLVKNAWVSVR